MSEALSTFIVLLRAIGPVTHRIMSMSQWRDAVEAAGYGRVETYVATGNMLMEGAGTPAGVTRQMNKILRELGLGSNTIAVVRRPGQMRKLLLANPFPEAAAERPGNVGVYFFAEKPELGWLADYQGPERLHVEGEHLIVDFPLGISKSPRLIGMIEKRSGTATARNWNTLRALVERAAARNGKEH